MKKILTTAVVTAALCILCSINAGADSAKVYIDAQPIEFTESTGTPFFDENDRTMVPLRAAMEAFGVSVSWNELTQSADLEKDGKMLSITPGDRLLSGSEGDIISDSAPVETGGRIYLPIRAVSQYFGGYVLWNEQLSSVFILSDKYIAFRDMFSYNGELSKYVDAVVVSASYNGDMSEEEFAKYWNSLDKTETETLIKIVATDKQSLNPDHEISINFWYPTEDSEKDCLIATVSSFSYEAKVYDPFGKTEINQLNQ